MAGLSKLKREITRAVQRITDPVTLHFERRATRAHDRAFAARLRHWPGAHTGTQRLALYLIWQPDGVLASTHLACQHLLDSGYAPVVVSNAPLSEADRATLLERAAFVVERPNFGYDFGGYRDGLRFIADVAGLDPDWLIMLNDSVWFPMRHPETLIAGLEAAGLPFNGAVHAMNRGRSHRAHYESYFFLVSREARASEAWRGYWAELVLTDVKRKVVLRGERDFSQAMFRAGFEQAGIVTREAFLARIASADAEVMAKVLRWAAYGDHPARHAERMALLAAPERDAAWLSEARAHVAKVGEVGAWHDHFRYAAELFFDLPLLKKRAWPLTLEMRAQRLRAARAGDLPALPPVIEAELRADLARHGITP